MTEVETPKPLVEFRGLTVHVEKIEDGHTETGFPKYKPGKMVATVSFQVGEKEFTYELKDFNADELKTAMENAGG